MSLSQFETAERLLVEARAYSVTDFHFVVVRLLTMLVRHVFGGLA